VSSKSHVPIVVLLVEDDALLRLLTAETLREEGGFEVIEASNSDQALIVLEGNSDVRACVTDVEMPGGVDGFTLARVVKQAWPDIGIVIMSGRAVPGRDDMPSGALFVQKPFSPGDLIEAIQGVLGSQGTVSPARVRVLPASIKISQLHTGIGTAGGLAQPLPEADE
jgi:CheY-like chemotaxis protein